jgi:hypothetical protein
VQINFGEAITLFAVIKAYFFIVGLLFTEVADAVNEPHAEEEATYVRVKVWEVGDTIEGAEIWRCELDTGSSLLSPECKVLKSVRCLPARVQNAALLVLS